MGIYLNPDNDGFWRALRSEIYVDKTGLIAITNKYIDTEQQYICVSRPRRFGKSMALNMLAAYYSRGCDSKELFTGCCIGKDPHFTKYLNKYDVILLNMQQFLIEAKNEDMTGYLEREVLEELLEAYGEIIKRNDLGLAGTLRRIYAKTKKKFIFLIDEWDCVMRERQEAEEMQKKYLDFLRNLLKDQIYTALVYMTGILPVKKYGEHSALNIFTEYSMADQDVFEQYTGFTQTEVEGLCRQYQMDFTETSNWYDGYMFTKYQHVYNPRSVVEAMRRHKFSNYWASTEAYDALKIYIDMDYDGLRADIVQMLGGGRVQVNTRSFGNDMRSFTGKDDVLTLLVHLGYLAYDSERKEAFIPNKEIIEEFENAMSTGGWQEIMRILKQSDRLLKDTLAGNESSVAAGLDQAHMEAASILTYNNEDSLSCAIGLAYYSARKDYRMIRELPAGRGFADIVFLPLPHTGKPALVVELKYKKSADTAIQQIKSRYYTKALEGYCGEILLVGISYEKDCVEKPHSCRIERLLFPLAGSASAPKN